MYDNRQFLEQTSEESFESGEEACLDVDRFSFGLGEDGIALHVLCLNGKGRFCLLLGVGFGRALVLSVDKPVD